MTNIILTHYAKRKCDSCFQFTSGICFYFPGENAPCLSLCDTCQAIYDEDAELKQCKTVNQLKQQFEKRYVAKRKGPKGYDLTLLEYQQMLFNQKGLCAACSQPETGSPTKQTAKTAVLAVDHCHKTGKVRGLLCRKCNVALGMLDDDPEKILALAEYIKRYQ